MNKPLRCFEGEAKPHERFWRVLNADESSNGVPEIDFEGVISEYSWYGDEITPQLFKDDLYKIGNGGPITIRMNSGGGDVIAASVIRSILADYPGEITMKIVGVAASAAVVVALAAHKIQILDTAYMMIHDPNYEVMFAVLDIETMRNLLSSLEAVKTGIQDTYAKRTGMSAEKIGRMMSDTTWMSANDAVKLGFADEVISVGENSSDPDQKAAVQNAMALKNYINVPASLLDCCETVHRSEKPEQTLVGDSLTEEEQRLRDEIDLYLEKE